MDDATKILAMTECLILWDYLAETGEDNKTRALRHLHHNKLISLADYDSSCPLCHYLRCQYCVWPRYDNYYRCCSKKSPYIEWEERSCGVPARKAAALKVLNLLLSIEF